MSRSENTIASLDKKKLCSHLPTVIKEGCLQGQKGLSTLGLGRGSRLWLDLPPECLEPLIDPAYPLNYCPLRR